MSARRETRADELFDALANRLVEAEQSGRMLLPFTREHPELTLADAYEIQARVAALKSRSGLRHVGWKTAFTNPIIRERFQAREPTRGHLFETALAVSEVSLSGGPDFLVEPEVTFSLAHEVSGPGVTESAILSATGGLRASLELARTRFSGGWKLEDVTADNAAAAYMVVSSSVMTPADVGDLASITVVLEKNGEVVANGTGSEVLGGPAKAVAWLANQLAATGLKLTGGQMILSGSFTLPIAARAGDRVVARFDRLGTIEVKIEP